MLCPRVMPLLAVLRAWTMAAARAVLALRPTLRR